ncbi:MAG: Hsp20/alpha crystallin family protein [Polyangiaceae bacterium]|nr:Hsp20/alpha crystallin family protein [Polyangiaceae bacterium]
MSVLQIEAPPDGGMFDNHLIAASRRKDNPMLNVEQAFAEVASAYQALTGRPFTPVGRESPPEVNPQEQAEANYRQFKRLMEQRMQNGGDPRKVTPVAPVPPPIDVLEFEREVRVLVDLPGTAREQVNVSITGDALTIRAERTNTRSGNGNGNGTCRLEERRKGAMLRSVALPPRARRDGIEALLRDGVLTISIPTDGTAGDNTEIPIEVK